MFAKLPAKPETQTKYLNVGIYMIQITENIQLWIFWGGDGHPLNPCSYLYWDAVIQTMWGKHHLLNSHSEDNRYAFQRIEIQLGENEFKRRRNDDQTEKEQEDKGTKKEANE